MEKDTGRLGSVKADGGASANNFLMQFQADVSGREVVRPRNVESTALGACFLAGLGCGIFESMDAIKKLGSAPEEFMPKMSESGRTKLLDEWHDAVRRTMCAAAKQ